MSKHKRRQEFTVFAVRIKHARELRGLSQPELGNRVGVSGQQIYRYEKGENQPDAGILTALVRELEVSADYLLGFVDDIEGHLVEADLPQDEREALAAFRAYKRGQSSRMMTVLAKSSPDGT